MLEINDPPHHWHAAKFILSIKERHTLTQSAVNCVVSSTTSLMSSINLGIVNELKMNHEVPDNVMQLLESKFNGIESIFSHVSTAYQQRRYFKEEFNKIVRSRSACLYEINIKLHNYRNLFAHILALEMFGKEELQSGDVVSRKYRTHFSIYHFWIH